MAKLEQPPTLLSSSINSVIKLFKTSAFNISKIGIGNTRARTLAFNLYNCKELSTVKKVFVEEILPCMWDSVFKAIDDTNEVVDLDNIILNYIFIHENLREFRVHPRLYPYIHVIDYHQLRNVVDLDLSAVPKEELFQIVEEFGRFLPKLQRICLATRLDLRCLKQFYGCTELRSITTGNSSVEKKVVRQALERFPDLEYFECGNIGDILHCFKSKIPLKLRKVKLYNCSVNAIRNTVLFCPHLQSLELVVTLGDCSVYVYSQVFDILASSSLQICELYTSVPHCNKQVDNFFLKKGVYLHRLSVRCQSEIPLYICQTIGRTCKNLTSLSLIDNMMPDAVMEHAVTYPSSVGNPTTSINNDALQGEVSVLRNLRELVYTSRTPLSMSIVKALVPPKTKLSALRLFVNKTDDEVFLELMDWISGENLAQVVLFKQLITESVLRVFLDTMPRLTNLLCALTPEAIVYLQSIQREGKKRHVDFCYY